MNPYFAHDDATIQAMLDTIGVSTIEALFDNIDPEIRTKTGLDLPEGISEWAVTRKIESWLQQNQLGPDTLSFAGGGRYQHVIPAAIPALINRSEFSTAYTPYQPEMSQGTLQAIFEFQTMICELTEMDVANASHYDGATAAAEGVLMAHGIHGGSTVLISNQVHETTKSVVSTYARFKGLTVVFLPEKNGVTDLEALKNYDLTNVSSVLIQSPNAFGLIEPTKSIGQYLKDQKSLYILSMNPVAMALFKSPGSVLADLAVGEIGFLGNPVSFGGPALGFMATRTSFMRKLPGRIVGEARDEQGRTGYVLTLQAREQHIRREKATSNITSNEALNALATTIYLALLGPEGLKSLALKNRATTRYLVTGLCTLEGIELVYSGTFFNEQLLNIPRLDEIYRIFYERNIIIGIKIEQESLPKNCLLVCATECHSKAIIDAFLTEFKAVYEEVTR